MEQEQQRKSINGIEISLKSYRVGDGGDEKYQW